LEPFFGGMRADQLSTDDMQRYRAKRTSEGESKAAQSTVNRELQILRKALKRAAALKPPKVRNIPVFEMAEEDNARRVFMTEEVKQRLKDAAARDTSDKAKMKGLYLRAFVELLFTLGWRKSELTGLTVENIHLAEGFIRIEDSKSGEPREAPLTPALKVLLEPLVIGKKPHEAIFPAKDMRWAWRRLCKSAGIEPGKIGGYIIHDTRRTAARTQRAAGVPESVSSKILGWQPGSKMYARYGIVDRADMNDALLRSEQWEQTQRESREAAETNWRQVAVSTPTTRLN
jgi:integrase